MLSVILRKSVLYVYIIAYVWLDQVYLEISEF